MVELKEKISKGEEPSKEKEENRKNEEAGDDDYDEMQDVPLEENVPLDDTRKKNLGEEDSSEEDANRDQEINSAVFSFYKALITSWRTTQRIVNTVFVQDDDPLYGRGTLGVFSGVYISYMQNILLLSIIFIRLPWIVGILSLSLASLAIFLVFATVFFSAFSVVAIATNGSDRLYGGPFTTIAYSLGYKIALVAGMMLCFANCGFTAWCLTTCTQLIYRYTLKHNPISPNLTERAFLNDAWAIKELCETPYYMHLIIAFTFLALITLLNAIGKRVLKWICWIPFTVFVILLVGITVAIGSKKAQKDIDLRCTFEPFGLRPKDRYHDQLPVMFFLPSKFLTTPPIHVRTKPSIMKRYCSRHMFREKNCSFANTEHCPAGSFRLQAFEWNFKVVRTNLRHHIVHHNNIQSYDWRDIVYDISFFKGIFTSGDVKFTSVAGSAVLLLPLFTGSVCGINIPSMLKSPTKNIPTGIFISLVTMLIVSCIDLYLQF